MRPSSGTDRRAFLRGLCAALAAGGVSYAGLAFAGGGGGGGGDGDGEKSRDDEAAADAIADRLVHDPTSLATLDLIGMLNFADAMGGIALQGDSIVQRVLRKLRGAVAHDAHAAMLRVGPHAHEHKFPLANLILAAALNVARATSFGEEARAQTLHELETTVIGVGLLMGLTSVARGIVSSEMTAMQMAQHEDTDTRADPEETLAASILQLTIVSVVTQIPLSSFGNASIGNEEFREVRLAFNEIYGRFLPAPEAAASRAEIVAHMRAQLERSDNPVVIAAIQRVIADTALTRHDEYAAALKAAATAHTHDLMTILMATACDDSQAAAGDPGPLVGLYQNYGIDFLQAVPSLVPYTVIIGIERAKWAAHRAGIRKELFTKERARYVLAFLKETWRNLIVYFATVAPEISSKIAGTGGFRGAKRKGDVGVNFSLLEQVLQDVESIITAVMDPFLTDRSLDTRKTRAAVAKLKEATRKWHEELGRSTADRIFPPRADHASTTRDEALAQHARIVGQKAGGSAPYPYKKDEPVRNLKDVQIRLATIVDESGIESFVAELAEIRRTVGPALLAEIGREHAQHGETPTVMTALDVISTNPRLRQLLDINYWHGRIGPALTDTLFIVTLQGLHLPFLLSTSERMMYDAAWFTRLPLAAREIVSVLYNNALGMFADNWADCVAHAKWLTNMYFSELEAQIVELAGAYPEVNVAIARRHFKDDPTRRIPERFAVRVQQIATLFDVLAKRHPEDATRIRAALASVLENAEAYYYKSMLIAMTISVVGAGKSLPGDSTHFTFAAGETDFTLAVTLRDFTRHPLYHAWQLVFSGAYAILIGPAIAQHLIAPGFSQLGIGSGIAQTFQTMMQGAFRARYPGMAERFMALEAVLAAEERR